LHRVSLGPGAWAATTTTITKTTQEQKHQKQQLDTEEVTFNTDSRVYFNFINSLHSDSTIRNYKFVVKKFMQYYNLQNIDQLLTFAANANAKENSNSTTTSTTRTASIADIENKIIDWLVYLRSSVV
jgi:hypothetical protein